MTSDTNELSPSNTKVVIFSGVSNIITFGTRTQSLGRSLFLVGIEKSGSSSAFDVYFELQCIFENCTWNLRQGRLVAELHDLAGSVINW